MRELLYSIIAQSGRSLDYKGLTRLGNGLGSLMWKVLRGRRHIAIQAVPERLGVSESEAVRIARDSFRIGPSSSPRGTSAHGSC